MSKRVLILEGSPRSNGNSDLLAEAYAAGARSKGYEVSILKVPGYKINGCFACNMCWSMGTPCVQSDDMGKLYVEIEQADLIVLASPLYFFGLSAQIKCVIDRLYPYYVANSVRQVKGKECVLLVSCATDEAEELEGLLSTYHIMTKYMQWYDTGHVIAYGMDGKGEVRNTKYIEQAKNLGAQ